MLFIKNMPWYSIWNELKLETLTPYHKPLLGAKLSEFPPMTLDHLGKRIKKNRGQLPMEYTNAVFARLVSYALVGCMALVFSLLVYQTTMYTYPSVYTEA